MPGQLAAGLLATTLVLGSAWAGVWAEPPAASQATPGKQDLLIFRNGNIMYGKIVTETPTTVRFKGSVSGIEFETDYPKTDILEIKKAATSGDAASGADPKGAVPVTIEPAKPAAAPSDGAIGTQQVYWLDLTGKFGEDISEKPIRDAMKDAKKNKADVIVLTLDADWSSNPITKEKRPDDTAQFDALFRAERIMPIFVTEMPAEWDEMPRIVFWVKDAMAGAAFMPLVSKEIYFASDGRVGGMGNLSQIFGSMGDDVVREKQRSLRLGHAEGWAITGGYDPRLIRAMARSEYVLSVKYEGGKAVLLERMPEGPDEDLLTDDGIDANEDTDRQKAAGDGNDVLTLNAATAKALGVSQGTVDTQKELLSALGLERTGVLINGQAKQIMKGWSQGLDNAKRQIRKAIEEYTEVRVEAPGDYRARSKARSTRIRKLEDIKTLLRLWGEGISGQWLQEYGVPDLATINTIQESIRIEQLKDKR